MVYTATTALKLKSDFKSYQRQCNIRQSDPDVHSSEMIFNSESRDIAKDQPSFKFGL